jgi:acetyl esterase/lipase
LRDRPIPVRGQLLVYPMLDDRTAVRADIGLNEHLAWTRGSNLTGWTAYLGTRPGGPKIPADAAAARCEDLSGLAPAWIGVGTLDLFLDECRTYARRLEEAGVPCDLEVVNGAFHGFDEIAHDTPVAQRFIDAQVSFLRRVLATDES